MRVIVLSALHGASRRSAAAPDADHQSPPIREIPITFFMSPSRPTRSS